MPVRKPNVRQRRLARALRKLRENAGMTAAQAGKLLELSPSMMSLLESGKRTVRSPDLFAMLDAYGVAHEDDRQRLFQLSQDARRTDWFSDYRKILSDDFRDYLSLEPEATEIRSYEPQCVPGLLETESYARALLTAVSTHEPGVVDTLVAVRLQRQDILRRDDPPQLHAIIDESVLRRPLGGRDVLREQLRHLVSMAERSNVTIQLLPFESVMFANSPFTILSLPEPGGMDAVFVENLASSSFLEDSDQVTTYAVLFQRLRDAALDPDTSRRRIADAAKELGRR